MNNIPFYPEPIFTKSFEEKNRIKMQSYDNVNNPSNNLNNINQDNTINYNGGNILNNLPVGINVDNIVKILPLLMNRKDKNNNKLFEIMKQLNPNAEKLFSIISSLNQKKEKKKANENNEPNNEIIDISEFEEVK